MPAKPSDAYRLHRKAAEDRWAGDTKLNNTVLELHVAYQLHKPHPQCPLCPLPGPRAQGTYVSGANMWKHFVRPNHITLVENEAVRLLKIGDIDYNREEDLAKALQPDDFNQDADAADAVVLQPHEVALPGETGGASGDETDATQQGPCLG